MSLTVLHSPLSFTCWCDFATWADHIFLIGGASIALYFYQHCDAQFYYFTEELKKAYQKLDAKKDDFEVVLVHIYDSIEVLRACAATRDKFPFFLSHLNAK